MAGLRIAATTGHRVSHALAKMVTHLHHGAGLSSGGPQRRRTWRRIRLFVHDLPPRIGDHHRRTHLSFDWFPPLWVIDDGAPILASRLAAIEQRMAEPACS